MQDPQSIGLFGNGQIVDPLETTTEVHWSRRYCVASWSKLTYPSLRFKNLFIMRIFLILMKLYTFMEFKSNGILW